MAAQEQIHEGGSVPQQTGIKLCQCALGKVQMQGGTASRRNHVATVVYRAIMGYKSISAGKKAMQKPELAATTAKSQVRR